MEDFPNLQQLNLGLFRHEAKKDSLINTNWPLEDAGKSFLRRMITSGESVCLVAQADNQLIGFLTGALLYFDTIRPIQRAQLINIFVEEQYRDQQTGTKLVDEFVKWCNEKQVKRILVTAQAGNTLGIKFYEHLGFHQYMAQMEKEI